jgi:hypothetical protein
MEFVWRLGHIFTEVNNFTNQGIFYAMETTLLKKSHVFEFHTGVRIPLWDCRCLERRPRSKLL